MFVPPDERRTWHPPQPDGRKPARGDDVLLVLIGLFLLSMLLAPIAGSSVVHTVLALMMR